MAMAIQDQNHAKRNRFGLMLDGSYLNKNLTLSDCNIDSESTLMLVPPEPIKISIQTLFTTGKVIPLTVNSLDSICDIKSMIKERENIAVDKQILSLSHEILKDECQVCSYSIVNDSVLELRRPTDMEICVSIKGEVKKIGVEETDTIRVVKF